ncbi:MAG TPA: hypothetical protein VMV19_15690 [Xanthobacteraceae bacterium]|nr:hypothetical protein [Xanthobacteraceae bacterium]
MDRIIFGDNQFFGVNHMSEEKARAQAMRFQDIDAVIAVLNDAYFEGIKTFMCTTHERISSVCDHFRIHQQRYPGYKFYPCMPYAHKYANAAAEHGMLGALRNFLPQENALGALLSGGLSLARKDIEGLAGLLIDAEMKMFAGLDTPVVFLQNVATDFLLGLGFDEAFRIFAAHVRERYGAEPGFITMNAPRLLKKLTLLGIENPIICANINKIDFRMCGGQQAYEEIMTQGRCRLIAMSVFASGAVAPEQALEYVCKYSNIESIVFGASSRRNIAQTVKFIERFDMNR